MDQLDQSDQWDPSGLWGQKDLLAQMAQMDQKGR